MDFESEMLSIILIILVITCFLFLENGRYHQIMSHTQRYVVRLSNRGDKKRFDRMVLYADKLVKWKNKPWYKRLLKEIPEY